MSFMEAMDRGLASTQLESAVLVLPVLVVGRPLPFGLPTRRGDAALDDAAVDDVDDRPRARLGLGDANGSVRRRLGVNGGSGSVAAWVCVPRPSACACACAAAALSRLLFRSSVARSGLLAVPGERYIERRFVCRSVSSTAS